MPMQAFINPNPTKTKTLNSFLLKVNFKVYFKTQTCFLIDKILSEFLLFLHKCSIFAVEIMIVRMNAITQKKPQSKMKYFPQIVDTPLY